ncbi:MAG TPA: DUF2269 family protein [Candidatus Dormibacteraeota bacterium]|nr:DUF2269 family protein [Candidatus Dormibacteraeota bacterium]
MNWYAFWLILHITAAIIAFGPTFVFPVVGPMASRDPRKGPVILEVFEALEDKLIVPFALTMPVSGAGLIITKHIDLTNTKWLGAAIILYIVAVLLAVFHQVPVTKRMIKLLRQMPEPMPGAAPVGPPAEFGALRKRTQIVGMILTVLLLTIIVLMIWGKEGGYTVLTQ